MAVHSIWLERNNIIHGKSPASTNSLVEVKQMVGDRVFGSTSFRKAAQKDFSHISSYSSSSFSIAIVFIWCMLQFV